MMKKTTSVLLASLVLAAATSLTTHAADIDFGARQVTTQSTALNVRSSPTTESTRIAQLQRNDYITVLYEEGDWSCIRLDEDTVGWCASDYLTKVNAYGAIVTNCWMLNVRQSPNGAITDVLQSGEVVVALPDSSTRGWIKILYRGDQVGYVGAAFLRRAEESEIKHTLSDLFYPDTADKEDSTLPSAGSAAKKDVYPEIKLSVPAYRQYDTRWANMLLGHSGQTMRSIGCTVTCIAMSESHRTGEEVTPRAVAESGTFTPDGAIYWPIGYTRSWDSDYLTRIYEQLSRGVPVLLHGKTDAGVPHWVLVTGYQGGDTLQVSGFSIHDPATVTRKTLADYFEDYPNYVKLAWYAK